MTDADYQMLQTQLLTFSGLLLRMPLADFVNRIEYSHATAPMVDPTLYRDAMHNLAFVEDIAHAAYDFQNAVVKAHRRAGTPEDLLARSRHRPRADIGGER